MRIAFRYGHNPACGGASGLVNEVVEDRKYGQKVIQLLQEVGNQCFDCTPPNMSDSGSELVYGTNHENAINPVCDLFLSFHINSASFTAHGAEMLISNPSQSPKAYEVSKRILSNLQNIGIYNRGVKCTDGDFNDIRESNAQAIILEPFFLTNQDNVNVYKNNFEGFCRAIANGIDGRVSLTSQPQQPVQQKAPEIGVKYQTHIEEIGWQDFVKDNEIAGTTGQSKRMESLVVLLENAPVNMDIEAYGHVEGYGWQPLRHTGEVIGSVSKGLRLEAVKIKLVNAPKNYHIEYSGHVEGIGWQDYVRDGEVAGTTGLSKRLEAIKIRIVKK